MMMMIFDKFLLLYRDFSAYDTHLVGSVMTCWLLRAGMHLCAEYEVLNFTLPNNDPTDLKWVM